MILDGDDDPFHRHVELPRRRLDDADVGLVRHQPVDVGGREPSLGQCLVDESCKRAHRHLEHFIALHLDRGRLAAAQPVEAVRHAKGIEQEIAVLAIGADHRRLDAGLGRRRQHDGTGAVGKQHAGVAVSPVDDPGQRLGADHQRAPRVTQTHELVGNRQPVDEAAAGRLQADRRLAVDTERRADHRRDVRKDEIRGGRADHDQIDVGRRHAGCGESAARGLGGHRRGGLVGRRDMAALDAGARAYPLVGGVDHLLEFAIGQHPLRQVAARTGDPRIDHAGVSARFSCARIRAGRPLAASASPMRTALAKANSSAEPWLFTTTPASPTMLAPL